MWYQKLWSQIKKRKIYLLLTVIFWALLLSILDPFEQVPAAEHFYGTQQSQTVALTAGMVIEERIESGYAGLSGLQIRMYSDEVSEQKILVKLYDDATGKLAGSTELTDFSSHSVQNYQWNFDPMLDSANHSYRLQLTVMGEKGTVTGLSLVLHDALQTDETYATVDGKQQTGALNLQTSYQNTITRLIWFLLWGVLVVLSFAGVLLLNEKLERNFLLIGCTVGLIYLLCNPFPHALDESTHFFRSFAITEGDWHDEWNQEGQIGATIADNYSEILEGKWNLLNWYVNPELYGQPYSQETSFYSNPYMSSVVPIDHAVGAIGIGIGRLLGLPAAVVIMLSRLANFAFYMVFCYLAIRKIAYYKTIFFGVALLPFGMFLAASCSQDAVLSGAMLYFIATCMNFYFRGEQDPPLKVRDWLPAILIMPFFISIKYLIYAPVLLLLFFVPKRKFAGRQKYCLIGIALLLSVLFLGYQVYLLGAFPFTEDRNGYVNVGEQIQYVFSNFYASYRNFAGYFFENLYYHLFGSAMKGGWNNSDFFQCSMAILVIFGAAFASDKYHWPSRKREGLMSGLMLFIFAATFALIIVALYAGYTPVGKAAVEGVQPRYLLPIWPLFAMALTAVPITNQIREYKTKLSCLLMLGSYAVVILNCLMLLV